MLMTTNEAKNNKMIHLCPKHMHFSKSMAFSDRVAFCIAMDMDGMYGAIDALALAFGHSGEEAGVRTPSANVRPPLGRARMLYDHMVDTVVYDKSSEGWGRGDSLYACDTRASGMSE